MNQVHLSAAGASSGLEALLAGLESSTQGESDQEGGIDITLSTEPELDNANDGGVIQADASADAPVVEPTATAPTKAEKKAAAEAARVQKKADAKIASDKKAADKLAAKVQAAADKAAADALKVQAAADKAAEPAAPKAPVEPRIFFGRNKLGRLEHRLGADINTAILQDLADADLEGDALTEKIAAYKADFKKLAVKVQNRATNVIEFVNGKSTRMNPVIEIAIRMLAKDRQLVTGDTGNLFTRLQTLYTPGAARSMGNSTMGMLKALQIVTESAKQTYVPNPNSALLAHISSKLSLSFVDVDAAIAAGDAAEAARMVPVVAVVEAAPVSLVDGDKDDSVMQDLLTGLVPVVVAETKLEVEEALA